MKSSSDHFLLSTFSFRIPSLLESPAFLDSGHHAPGACSLCTVPLVCRSSKWRKRRSFETRRCSFSSACLVPVPLSLSPTSRSRRLVFRRRRRVRAAWRCRCRSPRLVAVSSLFSPLLVTATADRIDIVQAIAESNQKHQQKAHTNPPANPPNVVENRPAERRPPRSPAAPRRAASLPLSPPPPLDPAGPPPPPSPAPSSPRRRLRRLRSLRPCSPRLRSQTRCPRTSLPPSLPMWSSTARAATPGPTSGGAA